MAKVLRKGNDFPACHMRNASQSLDAHPQCFLMTIRGDSRRSFLIRLFFFLLKGWVAVHQWPRSGSSGSADSCLFAEIRGPKFPKTPAIPANLAFPQFLPPLPKTRAQRDNICLIGTYLVPLEPRTLLTYS